MIFQITGANAKTGAEQRVRISADNESAALTLAKQRGIYPYKVERDLAAEQDEFERILEAEAEEQKRIEEAEARSRVLVRVEAIKNRLQSRLREGHSVFFYDTVYLPVDSELLGEQMNIGFDIPGVRNLGLLGWEVVQVVPRTVGIGLENITLGTTTMGKNWGGGSGGNVIGVHIILKKALMLSEFRDQTHNEGKHDEIDAYIAENLGQFSELFA